MRKHPEALPTGPAQPPRLPQRAAADWLALDQQLCFALYSASLAMTKAYKPLLGPLGLTYPQYLVMLALWEADGITVSALGDRLRLDSGTLTPLLKRLQQQGLLQRQRDLLDERRVLLQLSAAGQALKARAVTLPQTIACATACDLQQLAALTRQLRALRDQLAAHPPSADASAVAASSTDSPTAHTGQN